MSPVLTLGWSCNLETLDNFLNYVVRKGCEAELRVIVAEALPVKEEFTTEE